MRQTWTDLGLLILRLAGGLLAFKHGWGKLVRLAGGEGRFVNSVGELGFPRCPRSSPGRRRSPRRWES